MENKFIIQGLCKALLKAFNNQELQEIENFDSILKFIRTYLNRIISREFVIVNKGESLKAIDLVVENLPTRQLIYFGYNQNVALMAYNKGGIGKSECLLIFKLNNEIINGGF